MSPPPGSNAPFAVPGWAKLTAIVVGIATAVIVVYQLQKTGGRLRLDEHRQIEQVAATIVTVVGVTVTLRVVGVAYVPALVVAAAAGWAVVPVASKAAGLIDTISQWPPRARLLAGWYFVFIGLVCMLTIDAGRASRYVGSMADIIAAAAILDGLALGKELLDGKTEQASARSSD